MIFVFLNKNLNILEKKSQHTLLKLAEKISPQNKLKELKIAMQLAMT
jgi:hypothetical protein